MIKWDLRKLKGFENEIRKASRHKASGPMKACYEQWGRRYLTWTKRRYLKNARGAGDWPPLAAKTIARRRGEHRIISILIDTGTLLRALDIKQPGNVFKIIRGGVRVGFGGPARHPAGKATIADIARFHDAGAGRLPKRQILFAPDKKLTREMLSDLSRAINRIGKKAG